MTADQPTWHFHPAFPSGNKREVSFGRHVMKTLALHGVTMLLTCVSASQYHNDGFYSYVTSEYLDLRTDV